MADVRSPVSGWRARDLLSDRIVGAIQSDRWAGGVPVPRWTCNASSLSEVFRQMKPERDDGLIPEHFR